MDRKNRTKFCFIESLKDKLVIDIFCGGYHSWFLLNYDKPLDDSEV